MMRMTRVSVGAMLAVLGVGATLAWRLGAGWTAQAASALLVMLLSQSLSLGACALALQQASAGRLGFSDAARSRWIRDAVANLCAGAPGIGEAAGARALILRATPVGLSAIATATDLAGETLAQGLYLLAVLPLAPAHLWPRVEPPHPNLAALTLALAGIVMAAIFLGRERWRRFVEALIDLVREHALRTRDLAGCTFWHIVAWLVGGLQVWAALQILAAAPSIAGALALEGLVYLARAVAFVVPAGVGVQEAAVIGTAAALQIPFEAALTLTVLLRARDLIFGAPALGVWLPAEFEQVRSRLRVRANSRRSRAEPVFPERGVASSEPGLESSHPRQSPFHPMRTPMRLRRSTGVCDVRRGLARPWFGRKRSGRGVTPKSPAGWAAVLTLCVCGGLASTLPHSGWVVRDSLVLLSIFAFVLVVICKWEP